MPALEPLDQRRFEERLRHDLDLVRSTGGQLALLVIRLADAPGAGRMGADRTSQTLGAIMRRVQGELRPGDSVAQLDRDEFAVLQMPAGDVFEIHRLASRLLSCFGRAAPENQAGKGRASIGVALYPIDGTQIDLLLARARSAARRAQQWGGNGFCFHGCELARELAQGLAMDHELRQALRKHELNLMFTPVLDLREGTLRAALASLEWHHAEIGRLTPDVFLRSAERVALLGPLGCEAIEQACTALARWRPGGMASAVSLRTIGAQLHQPHFAAMVRETLASADLPGASLALEIDACAVVDPTDHALRTNLEQLAQLGVALTWRAFGKGPIDLAGLMELPISRLQLAPCLITAIGRCSRSYTVFQALVEFGLHLGKEVWADGVTTDEQLRLVGAAGCAAASGPLIGPALAASELELIVPADRTLTLLPRQQRNRSLH